LKGRFDRLALLREAAARRSYRRPSLQIIAAEAHRLVRSAYADEGCDAR